MRRAALLLLALLSACRRDPLFGDLDRLEGALHLAPVQRTAWNEFRREAESAERGARGGWRDALSGDRFDDRRARAAADDARKDAERLIERWKAFDSTLSPVQRSVVRRALDEGRAP